VFLHPTEDNVVFEPSAVSPQVTQNDMIMAERLFGVLAHVASSELPQYRLISILGEAR
jgi:hypothetical protein